MIRQRNLAQPRWCIVALIEQVEQPEQAAKAVPQALDLLGLLCDGGIVSLTYPEYERLQPLDLLLCGGEFAFDGAGEFPRPLLSRQRPGSRSFGLIRARRLGVGHGLDSK